MLKRDGYRRAPPILRARVWSQHVSKRHCERSEAIHLFLFVATMDCFVANAPRNDASACVAIPSTVIGLAEGENRWWRGDDGAAPTAARQPAPQEFAPTNECPCGSFAGRIFRSENGCCHRPDRSPPAPYRDRACA